jgi:hypothetical protein
MSLSITFGLSDVEDHQTVQRMAELLVKAGVRRDAA